MGQNALAAQFWRAGILLQFGHRGQRGGHQTGSAAPPAEPLQDHYLSGGFTAAPSGATAATAQPKYHEGLGPLMAGFAYAPFGDLDAVEN